MKKVFQRLVAMALAVVMLSGDAVAAAETLATLMLPASLKVIEEEAFMGTSVDQIVIPQGAEEIGERAFADGSIGEILVPESVKHIADNAFENTTLQAFTAEEDTYAYAWGVSNGFIKEDEDQLAPVITSCTLENGTGIHLEWVAHKDVSNCFRIDYSTTEFEDADYSYDYIYENQYTVYGLKANTTYYFRLISYDEDGQEHISQVINISTSDIIQEILITELSRYWTTTNVDFGSFTLGSIDDSSRSSIRIEPANATNQQLEWSSSDPTIASVDKYTGIITPHDYGSTTITVSSTDGSGISLSGNYRVIPNSLSGLQVFTGEDSITVVWNASSEADFYTIRCYTETYDESYYNSTFNETYTTFSNLSSNTKYIISLSCGVYLRSDSYTSTSSALQRIEATTGTIQDVEIPQAPDYSIQISCNKRGAAYVGDTVTWTAEAFGFTPKQYQFLLFKDGYLLKREATSDLNNYAHTLETAGYYSVMVKATDDKGNCVRAKSNNLSATIYSPFVVQPITSSEGKLINYTGNESELVIPEKIGEYTITEIANNVFASTKITSIYLPDSLSSIGNYAFYNCNNLTQVTLPNNLQTIGDYAFSNCSNLTEIILPENLQVIGDCAFSSCYRLDEITLPSKLGYIPNGMFANCHALENIILPDSIERIEENAFSHCTKLTKIALSSKIVSIEAEAFYMCSNLSSVYIPQLVIDIDSNAFRGCPNLFITCFEDSSAHKFALKYGLGVKLIPDYEKWFKYEVDQATSSCVITDFLKRSTYIEELVIPSHINGYQVVGIGQQAFSNCTLLDRIILPEGIASIADGAFSRCFAVEITLPSTVKQIGKNAFEYTAVSRIEIPEGIQEIPQYCFSNCEKLEEIILPSSVKKIGQWAFLGCNSLKSIELPTALTSIDDYAFRYSGISQLTVPNSVESIGKHAFEGCSQLCEIKLPDGLTAIKEYTFAKCTNLENIVLPDALQSIEFYAFAESALKFISVPGTVKEMDFAFYECEQLEEVCLKNGIACIESGTFYGCIKLNYVDIPSSVKTIQSSAFTGCKSLKSLYVPETVNKVDRRLFGSDETDNVIMCEPGGRIAIIAYENDIPVIPTNGNNFIPDGLEYVVIHGMVYITGYTGNASHLIIPEYIHCMPVCSIVQNSFTGCSSLISVKLPTHLFEIQKNAFANCANLESISFSTEIRYPTPNEYREAVTENGLCIGDYAFSGSGLTTVSLPDHVTVLGKNIFENCEQLNTAYLGEGITAASSSLFAGCNALSDLYLPKNSHGFEYDAGDYSNDVVHHVWKNSYTTDGLVAYRDIGDGSPECLYFSIDGVRGGCISGDLSGEARLEGLIWVGENDIKELCLVTYDAQTLEIVSRINLNPHRGNMFFSQYGEFCDLYPDYGRYYTILWGTDEKNNNLMGEQGSLEELDITTYPYTIMADIKKPYNKTPWLSEVVMTPGEDIHFSAYDDNGLKKAKLYVDGQLKKQWDVTSESYELVHFYFSLRSYINGSPQKYETGKHEIVVEIWDKSSLCTSNANNPSIFRRTDCSCSDQGNGYEVICYEINNESTHSWRKYFVWPCNNCDEIASYTNYGSGYEDHVWNSDGTCELCSYYHEEATLVENIQIIPEKLKLQVGQNYILYAEVKPDNSTKSTVVWSCDNTEVATITKHGRVTAVAEGSAVITVTAEDGSGITDTCLVTVQSTNEPSSDVPSVINYTLNNSSTEITVKEGDTIALGGTVYGGNANLDRLQVSILRADNQGLGAKFDNKTNINAASYALSGFDPIVVGQTYRDTDKNQEITMQAGHSYLIMLYAANINDVGFIDHDPTVEGPQGPAIKVNVVAADVQPDSAEIKTLQVKQSDILSSQVTVTGLLIMPDGYVVDDFNYIGIQYGLAEAYDAATDTGWKETLFAFVSADGSIELTIKQLKPETEYVFRAVAYDEKRQKWLCGNAIFHQMSVRPAYTESQIFYFLSANEQGYRNTYHIMRAETTGDIVKVELYIDGYQTKPEITETEWMGYRFFDIKTMIHEPGTRLVELKAYNTKGECLTAKTTIVVLDADYEKINTPKWSSPLPFEADGAIHGVAGYPFAAVWSQSENVKADKFSVRVWSAELQQYTFEGETSTPSIDIPATALPAPGDYTLALIAIKEGYDNSDILTQRIIAFDTYEASVQAECPHSTWTEQNIRVEYRDHSIKEIAGHYSKETFDISCLTCGLLLNKNIADSEYQFFEHHLIDDLYCLCGYSIHESEIDTFQSFDAFVKGTYAANVYRAPAYQSDYGTVFPGETVYVYALVNGWYKISYDTSSGRKFGYIQPEKISPYIEFELKTEVNGDSIVYEDVRYVDGEYYTSEILLPFGSLENGGLKGEWFCSDYSSDEAIGNNEHEWLITFDFTNAKEGETRECPVSVNPYIGIAATVSRAANAPISSITAKLLGGVVHFNLKQLCKLCGLRMKGHSVIPLPENYALEYQKEIEQASKELKMLFECQMREKDALYSGLTTFQAHIWPSMFYMGLWDGIRHDLRKFASTHIYDEIYNGDLLIRGMLMQKTQEYDSAFTDGLKFFATICENIVDNLSDGIAKRYDVYEMVRMLIDKDWKDGDFSVFIKQVEQFDPHGSISVEEFFNHDAVKIQIYDIYGDTLNAAEINKLKNLMSKWEGKLAKFLKSSHLQAASDILKMAPDVITEVQWQMLESSYKEIYLDYLDEWIAIEADPKMKKAYQNLKNDLEDEMADFTGFIDRTLFQSDIAGKAIQSKAQQWGSYFVHELVEKGKFGDKIKSLWEKKGRGLTGKFSKVLATAELANTVAECGLFIIQLTGLSLEDAKKRSEEITITWNAYDTNVRSMVQKLENLNETSYKTVIASMENCTNLLNYLFKLYGDEKEAAWDFQISNSEVASFRESNQQYIKDINKAIGNFEELIEEYYDYIN